MNFITRINNKLYKEYTKLLSTNRLINTAKRHIKKSGFMPIVIMYHHVTDIASNSLSVSKSVMEKNILFFKKHGFRFLFEEDFFQSDDYSVILTFDDGYQDNYKNLYPLLIKHNVKASINIIAKKLVDDFEDDYLNIDEIKEMLDSNLVSIQSHAYSHRKLLECTKEELETELHTSKKILENKLGINCSVLVTPYLQNSYLITSVAKEQYDIIYSDSINNTDYRYCISRIGSSEELTEKQLARNICLKAKKNAKFIKNLKQRIT